ncbi:MAG: hypothetical protein B7733_02000 [Myxococcales bacterium FL481]|nr:MAG: hypothetical protein B7733_02000 [Myxococcales bacterium FL481]
MVELEQTFLNFLLRHQERHNRTYHFIILMDAITNAAKLIEHYYVTGALKGNWLGADTVNVQGESVMRMDRIANDIVTHHLRSTGRVISAVSEENEERIEMSGDDGRYFVYFDPLDGSSNIAHGLPVGFMFGIAKRNLKGPEDHHLRTGKEFIAAGMFVIPTGTFTLALREAGTWRFHVNETGTFVKPTRMMLPEATKTWELSFNAGNSSTFAPSVQTWIAENQQRQAFRYLGALAGDFHRLLANGGMFMYPAIVAHPDPKKNRPEGKLRLLYEAAVVAFMAREAGGAAVDEHGQPILEVQPQTLHHRTALYVGSPPLVESIARVLQRH